MSNVNQSGWKPSAPNAVTGEHATTTGNRALMLEEPLIFEIGDNETTGVDFAPLPPEREGSTREASGGGPVRSNDDIPSPSSLRSSSQFGRRSVARTDPKAPELALAGGDK